MNVVDYLFEESKTSSKELVLGNSEKISYKEIYGQISKLSNYLEKDLGKNKKIIIMSDNSVFFYCCLFWDNEIRKHMCSFGSLIEPVFTFSYQ